MPRRGGTRFSSPSGASTRNAILCASGLIVLFSSGQDRGDCHSERKRIPAKWSIRVRRSRAGVFCAGRRDWSTTEGNGRGWDSCGIAGTTLECFMRDWPAPYGRGNDPLFRKLNYHAASNNFLPFLDVACSFLTSRDSSHTPRRFWILTRLTGSGNFRFNNY